MIAVDHTALVAIAGGVVVLLVLAQRLLFGRESGPDATKRPRP